VGFSSAGFSAGGLAEFPEAASVAPLSAAGALALAGALAFALAFAGVFGGTFAVAGLEGVAGAAAGACGALGGWDWFEA
jgi:hypothetical protein